MQRNRLAAYLAIVAVMAVLLVTLKPTWARSGDALQQIELFVHLRWDLLQNYVEDPDDQAMIEGAVRGMIETLNDPYTVYLSADEFDDFNKHVSGSFSGIGAEVNINAEQNRLEIISPLEDSPAYNAGVMAGDIVLTIDGTDTEGMKLTEAVQQLTGPEGTDVTIRVRHIDGEERDIKITRARIQVHTVRGFVRDADQNYSYWLDPERKIGYVRLTQFNQDSSRELREVFSDLVDQGMRGLIFDLRFNPGGLLDAAEEISDMFLPGGKTIVSVRGRSVPDQVYTSTDNLVVPLDVPVVVLANENSASASEIVAGALSENDRAVFVGTRTFGKGSVQQLKQFEKRELGALKLTNAYYYLPSGRNIHRRPINGDEGLIEVEKPVTETRPVLDDDGNPVLGEDGEPLTEEFETTKTIQMDKPWGVDPTEGQYVPMTVDEIRAMIEARRQRDVVRERDGSQAAETVTVELLRETYEDKQLAAALEAMNGQLAAGQWPQVGQANAEAIIALAEIESLKKARQRAMEAVSEIDEELAKLGAAPTPAPGLGAADLAPAETIDEVELPEAEPAETTP
ncbi:MAG: S41 family peptidase [Planctomycetota bacterium]